MSNTLAAGLSFIMCGGVLQLATLFPTLVIGRWGMILGAVLCIGAVIVDLDRAVKDGFKKEPWRP